MIWNIITSKLSYAAVIRYGRFRLSHTLYIKIKAFYINCTNLASGNRAKWISFLPNSSPIAGLMLDTRLFRSSSIILTGYLHTISFSSSTYYPEAFSCVTVLFLTVSVDLWSLSSALVLSGWSGCSGSGSAATSGSGSRIQLNRSPRLASLLFSIGSNKYFL